MIISFSESQQKAKEAITEAAARLFARRGYDSVTMREIARAAGYSHTTIYLHFKNKAELLHHLAMDPLTRLRRQMLSIFRDETLTPKDRLRNMGLAFIRYNLANRTLYTVFFDAATPATGESELQPEIHRIKNELFGLLIDALAEALPDTMEDERLLVYGRIHLFTLHGMVAGYVHSPELTSVLMERLRGTFDTAFDVLLTGFEAAWQRDLAEGRTTEGPF